uniref:Uncharacterized protein n=1 Tax=Candidatus Kentrum sp. MB TaxID=2138164 RepID=A0A451BDP1_9GAMM|nr:MAG: hypothetical protein BECKMB1821I_GA0114274_10584 [Candidatus Kentron sp. MB]VFK76400.1 MAG: hypothetical protein BECKMB1821H_GA0114242_10554 [Candidatus Kentron sp. MB]
MITFLIAQTVGDNGLDEKLPEHFGDRALRLRNGDWLVAYNGTLEQLASEIGVMQDETNVIIFPFTEYWGRESSNIWVWMRRYGNFVYDKQIGHTNEH